MNWSYREPTLDEVLSDSIIGALMEADGIDPQELAATLREVGLDLVRGARVPSRIQLTINAKSRRRLFIANLHSEISEKTA